MAESGYTLPVWVAAAARAALAQLVGEPFQEEQPLLLELEGAAAAQPVPVVAAAPAGEPPSPRLLQTTPPTEGQSQAEPASA